MSKKDHSELLFVAIFCMLVVNVFVGMCLLVIYLIIEE